MDAVQGLTNHPIIQVLIIIFWILGGAGAIITIVDRIERWRRSKYLKAIEEALKLSANIRKRLAKVRLNKRKAEDKLKDFENEEKRLERELADVSRALRTMADGD